MGDELSARIAAGSRVVVFGSTPRAADVAEALRAAGCAVTAPAAGDGESDGGPFDAAVVMELREHWGHPSTFFHRLRPSLAPQGQVLVSRAETGSAAVRVAVYGDSGEDVAPVVRPLELERFSTGALRELLGAAGYRVAAGDCADGWIVGSPLEEQPKAPPTPEGVPRPLAGADAEVRDLRAFARAVLERQRRLHEELARLRASVARRDASLAALDAALADAAAAQALARERGVRLDAAQRDVARAEATILDLEARLRRLTEALTELRARSGVD